MIIWQSYKLRHFYQPLLHDDCGTKGGDEYSEIEPITADKQYDQYDDTSDHEDYN